MSNKAKILTDEILSNIGGKENVVKAENCMTRLRLTIAKEELFDEDKVKNINGVLGLVHDKSNYYEVVVGPGTCKECVEYCKSIGVGNSDTKNQDLPDWKENKQKIKGKQKKSSIKSALKTLGEIFVPLIPGVMSAGLASGIAALIAQLVPDYASNIFWGTVYNFLKLINVSFMTYISAWAGYRTAERFGGTPILGGMVGMITTLENINSIAEVIGINTISGLGVILSAGRGGVIAALIGAWLVAKVEIFVHKHMYNNIDIVVTPIISLFIVVVPYVLLVMPAAGLLSSGIAYVVELATLSDNIIVKIITGYVTAALFLPLVAMGLHHSLIAVYTVQLNTIGYITLYPALCMGGFGQIGAALAIYIYAKRFKNNRLRKVIAGSVTAGILGVGEPLIYGVTLPLGRPFFTAGLGAGFGGAIVMSLECASTSWGPSGLLGAFVVTGGPNPPLVSIGIYLIAGVISTVMGFIISYFFLDKQSIKEF